MVEEVKMIILRYHGIETAAGVEELYSCGNWEVKRGGVTPPVEYGEALRLITDFPDAFTVEREVVAEDVLSDAEQLVDAIEVQTAPTPTSDITEEEKAKQIAELETAAAVVSMDVKVIKVSRKSEKKIVTKKGKTQVQLQKLSKPNLWKEYKKLHKQADPEWKLGVKANKKELVNAVLQLQELLMIGV